MKTIQLITRLSLAFILMTECDQSSFTETGRIEKNIDFDWYFHPGDVTDGQLTDLGHSEWRKPDLPHDWSIEGEYTDTFPGQKELDFYREALAGTPRSFPGKSPGRTKRCLSNLTACT